MHEPDIQSFINLHLHASLNLEDLFQSAPCLPSQLLSASSDLNVVTWPSFDTKPSFTSTVEVVLFSIVGLSLTIPEVGRGRRAIR